MISLPNFTGMLRLKDLFLLSRKFDSPEQSAPPKKRIQWDQPHEGNLFEFLYRRRRIGIPQNV